MKECRKCGITKPLSDFYKHSKMLDGHLNNCKECVKYSVSANRSANIEYYRQYDRERSMNASRVAARELYRRTEKGREVANAAKKRWQISNPTKKAASTMVGNAVRDGRLQKGPCEVCGETNHVHGHHDDYSKPLDVRWLCSKHHREWHKANGEGLNADAKIYGERQSHYEQA